MLILIVGLLGYWMGPDSFSGSLINAFESIEILFWAIGAIISVIMLAINLGLGAILSKGLQGKTSIISGSIGVLSLSLLATAIMFIKVAIMILLCQYMAGSITPEVMSFNDLSNNQIIAGIAIFVLPFIGNLTSK